MNYLAHCWLSNGSPAHLAGALFGDIVRGRDLSFLPTPVEDAVRLHRAIDVFTDNHALVVELRKQLPVPLRRYAGIVLDMGFDHVLARDFASWHDESLRDFAERVYAAIAAHRRYLDDQQGLRLQYIVDNDLLFAYQDFRSIDRSLRGIGSRLRRENPLPHSAAALQILLPAMTQAAQILFPALKSFSADFMADRS